MKRLILVVVLALSTVFAPAARAAMPPVAPTEEWGCWDDDMPIGKGSAKLWVLGNQLAAKNPCTYLLEIQWGFTPAGSPAQNRILLKPGAKFNWDRAHSPKGFRFPDPEDGFSAGLQMPKHACRRPNNPHTYAVKVYAYNDVRPIVACVFKNGEWRKP